MSKPRHHKVSLVAWARLCSCRRATRKAELADTVEIERFNFHACAELRRQGSLGEVIREAVKPLPL